MASPIPLAPPVTRIILSLRRRSMTKDYKIFWHFHQVHWPFRLAKVFRYSVAPPEVADRKSLRGDRRASQTHTLRDRFRSTRKLHPEKVQSVHRSSFSSWLQLPFPTSCNTHFQRSTTL